MNAIKIDQNGNIIDIVRHPDETEDRNCFHDWPDNQCVFISDTEANTLENVGYDWNKKWDGTKLVNNPAYTSIKTAYDQKKAITDNRKLRSIEYIKQSSIEGTFETSVGDWIDAIADFIETGSVSQKLQDLLDIRNSVKQQYPGV